MSSLLLKLISLSLILSSCGSDLVLSGNPTAADTTQLPQVSYVEPRNAGPGDKIRLYGYNLNQSLQIMLGTRELKASELTARYATIYLPDDLEDGVTTLKVLSNNRTVKSVKVAPTSMKLSYSGLPSTSVCKGVAYLSKDDIVEEGEQDCKDKKDALTLSDCSQDGELNCVANADYPAIDKIQNIDSIAAKIDASLSFAGVTGSLMPCSATLASDCYIAPYNALNQPFKALDANLIVPGIIKNGVNIAGILGTIIPRPADCNSDNQTACVTTTGFAAVDKANLDLNKFKLRSATSLVGITGSMGNCAANGSGCFLTPYAAGSQNLKAINFDGITADILLQGTQVAMVTGTLVTNPSDCGTDGGTACLTTASYPAVQKSLVVATKIQDSLTVGGVTGTLANCSSDNDSSCFAMPLYPAVDKAYANSNKALFHDSLSIAGISGTMNDCNSENQLGCYTVATFPSIDKNAVLAAKIKTGFSIVGVAGSLSNCTAEQSNCFLPTYAAGTQSLKAIDFDSLSAANIKTGNQISTVSGSLVQASADCNSDAQTACVTVAAFPAINKTLVDGLKTKVDKNLSFAGIIGTLDNCNSDGQNTCIAVTGYPAIEVATVTAQKAKMSSSVSVGGVAGTLDDCTTNGSDCYLATYATVAQPLKAIDYSTVLANIIKTGESIAGVNGSMTPAPADCNADAAIGCTTVANFPAVLKTIVSNGTAKFSDTLTLAGLGGAMDNCNSEGDLDCQTTATYPALDLANLNANTAGVNHTISIASVNGTMSDCAGNDSNCFIPLYASGSQNYKAVNFDSITAGVIKGGSSLAGVNGDYPSASHPMTPGDAYADLTSGTFNSKIGSASAFGWFNSSGQRQSTTGDTDITASKIKSSIDIFGNTGTLPVLDPWDVRAGVNFGSASTGKLKLNCRNPSHSSTWDIGLPKYASWASANDTVTSSAHGFSDGQLVIPGYLINNGGSLHHDQAYYVINATTNTFQLSTSAGGAPYDITNDYAGGTIHRYVEGTVGPEDNMDLYNGGSATIPSTAAFGNNYYCGGVEATSGDSNVWKDMTTGTCTGGAECRFMDKITRLEWTKRIRTSTWAVAAATCEDLVYDGKSDWHLPSQHQLQDASSHSLYGTQVANWLPISDMNGGNAGFWTSTRISDSTWQAWYVFPANNETMGAFISSQLGVICTRETD